MAEGPPHIQRLSPQVPVACGVCEGLDNVSWYCLHCHGNLCVSCKVGHSVPIFIKHELVPIFEGLQQRVSEQEECRSHPAFVYIMYCKDCRNLVCKRCVSTQEHKGHELIEIEEAMRKVYTEIVDYSELLKSDMLQHCGIQKADVAQRVLNCKQRYSLVESEINNRCEEIKKQIENEREKHLQAALTEKNEYLDTMVEADQRLDETIYEIQGLVTNSEETLFKSDSEKVSFNIEKYIPTPTNLTDLFEFQLSFLPGKSDDKLMAKMIGQLYCHTPTHDARQSKADIPDDTEKVGLPEYFMDDQLVPPPVQQCVTRVGDTPKTVLMDTDCKVQFLSKQKFNIKIDKVIVVDGKEAWVGSHLSEPLIRVNTEGQVVSSLNKPFQIQDFAITSSGDLIVTDYKSKSIRRMTPQGAVYPYKIRTQPYSPTGIVIDRDTGDIIVCINSLDNSSSSLVIYSRNGKKLRILTYTRKPVGDRRRQYVTQNQAGDYCIVHKGHRTVYVIDKCGSLRITYDGSGAKNLKQMFHPYRVCGGHFEHLIISDQGNHAIHVIDQLGNFIRYLLTAEDGIYKPTGLCLDKEGNVWIGQDKGGLSIVRYT